MYDLVKEFRGCTVLSKCANPACSEQFKYLHQGKLFQLTPTPEVQVTAEDFCPWLYERFWLCEECSKKMTLVWGGTEIKLVPLPPKPVVLKAVDSGKVVPRKPKARRTARVGAPSD